MSVFAYTGRDGEGRRRRGYVEAESAKAARARLRDMGVVAESLDEPSFRGRFTAPARARFYEGAGTLLQAGFGLGEALGLLASESAGDAAGALLSLRARVMDGLPLSQAVPALAPHLPGFERAALRTAEESGAQGEMLARLAAFLDADLAVRDRVRGALVYPCAVLVLALALLALMAFVVLPRAAALFPAGETPASARALIRLAPAALGSLLAIAGFAAAAFAALAARARAGGRAALRYERLLLSLPLARRLLPLLWASRFAGTMGLLVKAGLNPQSAVAAAGAATGSATVAAQAAAAEDDVRGGQSLSQALARLATLAPHLLAWVAVGEKAGALGETLSRASARCRDAYEKTLSRALALLEPTLVAAVGAVVLVVALAVIRPMLELTTGGFGGLAR